LLEYRDRVLRIHDEMNSYVVMMPVEPTGAAYELELEAG
jgi:hypothetical protein